MIYIFLALIFYTAAILVGAAASRNLNPNLAAAINNVVSSIIPVAVVVPLLARKTFLDQKFGIYLAVVSGVLVAVFTMALSKAYSQNKIGIVAPMVFGGAILLSSVLSYFLYREKITPIEGIGLAVLGVGFALITYARATAP